MEKRNSRELSDSSKISRIGGFTITTTGICPATVRNPVNVRRRDIGPRNASNDSRSVMVLSS